MSASAQQAVNAGNEPGHPAQIPSKQAEGGISQKAEERPDVAGDERTNDRPKTEGEGSKDPTDSHVDYPEQKHAGKVGYGPHYAEVHGHVSTGEKLTGLREELKGKITHNQKEVQEGRDRRTGQKKKKELDEGESKAAFATAKADDSEGGAKAELDKGKDAQSSSDKVDQERGRSSQSSGRRDDQKPTKEKTKELAQEGEKVDE